MIFLSVAIILFEIAYRKKDGQICVFGIESLVVAVFTLFLPYIIFELNETQRKYYLMASIYIATYYILKSIYISTRTKAKYMNTISDVKEIVKKEKKKVNTEEIENLKNDKINTNNDEVKKQQKKVKDKKVLDKNNKKTNTIPKKREKTKKEIIEKESKEENTAPKKRGRPKKTENQNNETKQKESETPKKRGRPRKAAVVKND